uniref:ribonuclease E n=1 Tax=Hypnea brasiliensis TaxID=1866962 RepID=UPI0023F13716|nr:ribonuclease E [Hypnea brasiliensis]WCH55241.1 ribonuclease E [Hypnea brasiliensis]WDY84780.1 ribonuclease E [Hypnea brasiliensis]
MVKKIIISRFNNIAAILQNNKIQEIIPINKTYQVNDIYIGIVQKIFSSINAAFIKISNHGKSGFIHISDIKHLKKNRYINHINDILAINQILLVQIIKEPTINKGPRLTTNINLSGKYTVLMPFCNTICISHKIYDHNERIHLHSLAILLKPSMMGILIRSSAEGKTTKAIIDDLNCLKKQWYSIEKMALCSPCPNLIYKEKDLVQKIIRDYYNSNTNNIIIDSENGLQQIKYYIKKWNCKKNTRIQIYKKPECILEQFGIIKNISKALKSKVKLSSGGHLIIESNEALTVIDVNSGSFNKSDNSKEAILRTNFYAAIEIAYQLKMRNINGVIIVDFIDMLSQQDQLQLLEHFTKLLQLDYAKPQIVQLSELGLVELTRRRRRQSLQELFNNENNIYLTIPQHHKYNQNEIKTNISKYLLHKNIKSLFFSKKFRKKIVINYQNKNCKYNLFSKDFIYLNKNNIVHLLNPKRNYIIPFIIYSNALNKN